MEKLQQSLLLTHLKYQTHPQNLKVIAFQQLIEKVLIHSGNQAKSIQDISSLIAKTLGIKRLDRKHIGEALDHLYIEKRVELINNKWKLVDDIKAEINNEIKYFDTELRHILETYFENIDIGRAVKKEWFSDACSRVFSEFGENIVASILKPHSYKLNGIDVEATLLIVIQNHDLSEYREQLLEDFSLFLHSEDIRERDYIYNMAMAMTAMRIVTANIGVDPVGLDFLRGTTFIVDTNVLINLATEKKLDRDAMSTLFEALHDLDIKLTFIQSTEIEYKKVIEAAIDHRVPLFNTYKNFDVLKNVDDDLINAAIEAGISDYDGAKKYFTSLLTFPPVFQDFTIGKLENELTEEVTEDAPNDLKLIKQIKMLSDTRDARRYLKKYNTPPKPRSEASIQHDVTLIRVAEALREEGESYSILTADGIVGSYTPKKDKHKLKVPLTISFDTLIEILAIHNGGHKILGMKFAPLLSKVIQSRCMPSRNAYTVPDLRILANATDKAATMSPEEVKRVVKDIKLHELNGSTSHSKIVTAVERALSDTKEEENVGLKQTIHDQSKINTKMEARVDKLKEEHIRNRLKKLNRITTAKWCVIVSLLLVIIFIATYFTFKAIIHNVTASFTLGLIADVASVIKILPDSFSRYGNEKQVNLEKANKEVEELLKD